MINRQFSAVRLRDQVRASRAATTFEIVARHKTNDDGNCAVQRARRPILILQVSLSAISVRQESAILSARRVVPALAVEWVGLVGIWAVAAWAELAWAAVVMPAVAWAVVAAAAAKSTCRPRCR